MNSFPDRPNKDIINNYLKKYEILERNSIALVSKITPVEIIYVFFVFKDDNSIIVKE